MRKWLTAKIHKKIVLNFYFFEPALTKRRYMLAYLLIYSIYMHVCVCVCV